MVNGAFRLKARVEREAKGEKGWKRPIDESPKR